VAAGPYTDKYFKVDDSDLVTIEQEYYEFVDKTGMPDCFIEAGELGGFNGMQNNDGFQNYKMALHEEINPEKFKKWAQIRIPSKVEEILNNPIKHKCWWCFNKNKFGVYQTKDDGVHYLYGFKGHGFTYMPIHGKIVLDVLINKNPMKYCKL